MNRRGGSASRRLAVCALALAMASCSSSTSLGSSGEPGSASDTSPSGSATVVSNSGSPASTSHATAAESPSSASESSTPSSAPGSSSSPRDTSVDTSFPQTGPISDCAFTPPTPTGEVSWIQDGQLRVVGDDRVPRCLLGAVAGPVAVRWSPNGRRVLVGPNTAAGPEGTRVTGYNPTNQTVSWSQPTGKALLGITEAKGELTWRYSTKDDRKAISFLARTDEAVYHPAGRGIVAVGVDESGTYGVWLASNRGANRTLIAHIEDPATTVSHLTFSADGTTLYFIHDHGDEHHVHALQLDGLILTDFVTDARPISDLTVSTVDSSVAWRVGPCDATGSVLAAAPATGPATDLRAIAGSPFASSVIQPIGWLSAGRLVIAARASGCDGPADVWLWSGTGGFEQIGAGWMSVSVRIPRGAFEELPTRIQQAAPG